MRFVFEAHGETLVDREFERFAEHAENLTPVWKNLADLLRNVSKRQFSSEGQYASGGWAPLAPSTLAAKKRQGLSSKILHATLALKNSLTQKSSSDQQLIITPLQLVFGSLVEYAGFHQHGTSTMPRRPPLDLREATRREFVRRIQRYIVTGNLSHGDVV